MLTSLLGNGVQPDDRSNRQLTQLAEAAARQMAAAASDTVGVALVAEPDRHDDRADKDEGSAFAVCVGEAIRSRAYGFGGASEDALRWSTTWALSAVWQMLVSRKS
jgi:hypothetical protein